jgi:hypothetical protein
MPESLNGVTKLLKASCGKCRDITSKFEWNINRSALGRLRAAMQYKTKAKRKKSRARSYPVKVKIKGESKIVEMPVEAVVGVKPMLDASLPAYLLEKHFPDVKVVHPGLRGVALQEVYRSREKTAAFLEEIGAESMTIELHMSVDDFARMIAKIAYCEAIATLYNEGLGGFDDIEEVYVLPLILGDVSDPWRFIGTQRPTREPEDPSTNPSLVLIIVKHGDILALIQLFVPAGGNDSEYVVAVGRASERLREHLRGMGDTDI